MVKLIIYICIIGYIELVEFFFLCFIIVEKEILHNQIFYLLFSQRENTIDMVVLHDCIV